jgi:hypothetical protein
MKENYRNIFLILIFLLGFCSCKNTVTTIEAPARDPEYMPGQIAVGLVDTVSYRFMVNFCNSLNLGIIHLDLEHTFWAKADSNDLEYYRNIFSSDSAVVFINKLYTGSSTDTLLITISFTGINTVEYDLKKVESVGLNVYEIHTHFKTALLSTAIGREKYWINKLIHYDFIRYAELNYVTHAF